MEAAEKTTALVQDATLRELGFGAECKVDCGAANHEKPHTIGAPRISTTNGMPNAMLACRPTALQGFGGGGKRMFAPRSA
jgi:hypothetical protein